MGSSVFYRWNEWGYQETVLHLRIGNRPEAAVWVNHPGEVIPFGYGRPSYWGGCASLPRLHQYRGLAVLEFTAAEGQPQFTHVWFPSTAFDESAIHGNLALARCGEGGVMLKGAVDFEPVTQGPFANCEIRQTGEKTQWIIRVCQTESLQSIQNRFGRIALSRRDGGEFQVDDPEYGSVVFHADGTVEAEGRLISPDDYSIAGKTEYIAPHSGVKR